MTKVVGANRDNAMLRAKTVYLNDTPIGHASTWTEVYALLQEKRIHFIGKPGVAEGPTAFYLQAPLVASQARDTYEASLDEAGDASDEQSQ